MCVVFQVRIQLPLKSISRFIQIPSSQSTSCGCAIVDAKNIILVCHHLRAKPKKKKTKTRKWPEMSNFLLRLARCRRVQEEINSQENETNSNRNDKCKNRSWEKICFLSLLIIRRQNAQYRIQVMGTHFKKLKLNRKCF